MGRKHTGLAESQAPVGARRESFPRGWTGSRPEQLQDSVNGGDPHECTKRPAHGPVESPVAFASLARLAATHPFSASGGRRRASQPWATRVGRLNPARQIPFVVALKHGNRPEIQQWIRDFYEPAHANHMPAVPNGELAARVSPSDAEYRDVIEFLVNHGFSVNETYDNRLLIDASGAVKDIEATFRVQMNEYRWNGKSFYAPAGKVVIPVAVAGVVQEIVGLSTLSMVSSSPRHHR